MMKTMKANELHEDRLNNVSGGAGLSEAALSETLSSALSQGLSQGLSQELSSTLSQVAGSLSYTKLQELSSAVGLSQVLECAPAGCLSAAI